MIASGLDAQNAQLMQAFKGVYLIKLDIDEWNGGGSLFHAEVIPVFFRLDLEGRPTGDKIDADAWETDTYKNIANAVGPWFHRP